jgi:hypothetical protein
MTAVRFASLPACEVNTDDATKSSAHFCRAMDRLALCQFRIMTQIAGHQVVGASGIGAFQKDIVVGIGGDLERPRQTNRIGGWILLDGLNRPTLFKTGTQRRSGCARFLFVRHWSTQEGEGRSPARTWRLDQRQAFTPAVILFIAPASDG